MSVLANAHALLVAIPDYWRVRPLPEAVRYDARDLRDALCDPALCAYPSANVTLLERDTTADALRATFGALAARCDADSSAFVYLSCHGGRIERGPHAGEYLLPVEADPASDAALAASSISGAEFTALLRAIPARKLVVALDCCHAGGIGQPKDAAAPILKSGLPEAYLDALKAGRGRVILASSRPTEFSWILPGARNSLFTHHLLAGLRGEANGAGGVIRIFDLFDYVQPRVTADTPQQHPLFKAEIEENFPVALYLGGSKGAPPTAPAPADGYAYDAFISHSEAKADRRWVRETLAPALEAAGLRVLTPDRAPLGMPKIHFAERAVQESRYTVLALSEAYLASGYGDFEGLLAQHLGLEESAYRVLPVLREDCTPRLGLRILPLLDLSADEFDWNIARLIEQLGRPPAA